jgi:hypothetical protein
MRILGFSMTHSQEHPSKIGNQPDQPDEYAQLMEVIEHRFFPLSDNDSCPYSMAHVPETSNTNPDQKAIRCHGFKRRAILSAQIPVE